MSVPPAPLAQPAHGRWEVRWLDHVASTQDVAVAAARDGHPGRLAVATLDQRGGRGRMGRAWVTPPGDGLACSVVVRPTALPPAEWGWLPLAAGLGVLGAVRGLGADAVLKWPNDVLLHGAKLCGVLSERVDPQPGPGSGSGAAAAVLGIGLNLRGGALPPEGIALADAPGRAALSPPEPDAVVAALLDALDAVLTRLDTGQVAVVRADYRAACATLGRTVVVQRPDGSVLEGRAEDVDAAGRLVVRDASGTRVVLAAGDVTHVRGARA
jgi:BirA family biotin operon repressor/biotin-[acetyl-CoA-carboxylase] ligase